MPDQCTASPNELASQNLSDHPQPAPSAWAAAPDERLRTVWVLLSPSRVPVAVGVDHGDLLAAAGLPALPAGFTVSALQITGAPEAFDHVVDPFVRAWSPAQSARFGREQRALSRVIEARHRELLSRRLAAGDDGALEELADIGEADEDTVELSIERSIERAH